MTDKEIVERAKEAEKRTVFGELVHSPTSKGVNSAFGIGFIEGMVEYRNSMQEETVYTDFTKALAECIHQSQCNVVDPMVLAETWKDELIKLAKSEEPVSEDLEKASKEWIRPQLDKSYADYGETKMMELTHFDGYAMLDAIEFGVKWQKAKDESTTEDLGEYINELSKQFPEVSFAKLSRIAVRVAQWQKQQIMKDAVEGEIVKDIANNLYIGKAKVNKNNFKFGDKVKLLVLKEE